MIPKIDYTFSDYQRDAAQTATYPHRGEALGLFYLTAGLASEAGEVAGKIAKCLRDADGVFDTEWVDAITKELGDTVWFLTEIATHLGVDLGDVAAGNTRKLQDRMRRGVLGGSGDNR